ncbi:MAG: HlyD family efflux transporter periplasmic adaptor subunit [Candidatus Paceibacterota bacterium]
MRNFLQKKRNKILLLIALILVMVFFVTKDEDSTVDIAETNTLRTVTLKSVTDLSTNIEPLKTSGTVESQTDATIRARKTGVITKIHRTRGEIIPAGALIAEIEHAGESASLRRAQATLAQAEANLSRLTGGSGLAKNEIVELNYQNALTSRNQAFDTVYNSLRSAYASIDDSIRNKADAFFSNPRTSTPVLVIPIVSYQEKINLESKRTVIETMLNKWETTLLTRPTQSEFKAFMEEAESDLDTLINFTNTLSSVVNNMTPDSNYTQGTIDGYKASMNSARAGIAGAVTATANAKTTFTNSETAFAIAEQERILGIAGVENEEIISAEASVEQARAGVIDAQVALGYAYIRTPVTGTLNELSIRLGSLVTQNEVVAEVISQDNPEVIAYITEDEGNSISIGSLALIDMSYQGTVTYVSPALTTNGKREVRISLTEADHTLSINSTVPVLLERTKNNANADAKITLPLSALKVRFNDTAVFTVTNENKLVAHPVTVGRISGDRAEVTNIDTTLYIVTDARGLDEGDEVNVSE